MPLWDKPDITLIDGHSGSGKSRYAAELAHETGAMVVSIDEVYPGWDGLDAGSAHIYEHVLRPLAQGLSGRYLTWSWEEGAPGQWREVPAGTALIVEGCGAIRHDSAEISENRLWLEAPEDIRRERALARDGDMYAPHWTRWALQEQRFLALHDSRRLAQEIRKLG